MKRTRKVMKDQTGKAHQHNKSKLSRNLLLTRNVFTLEAEIAKKYNEFFREIGLSLARKSPIPSKPFCRKKWKANINSYLSQKEFQWIHSASHNSNSHNRPANIPC